MVIRHCLSSPIALAPRYPISRRRNAKTARPERKRTIKDLPSFKPPINRFSIRQFLRYITLGSGPFCFFFGSAATLAVRSRAKTLQNRSTADQERTVPGRKRRLGLDFVYIGQAGNVATLPLGEAFLTARTPSSNASSPSQRISNQALHQTQSCIFRSIKAIISCPHVRVRCPGSFS
jgi:hypothetical protein